MGYSNNSYFGSYTRDDPELDPLANDRTRYAKAPPISDAIMDMFRRSVIDGLRTSRAFRKQCLQDRLDKWNRGECSLSTGDVAAIGRQLQEIAEAELQDIQYRTAAE